MTDELRSYVAIADAIALLLHPHAEVVIHDLQRGELAHIAGNFSRRCAGDSSLSDLVDIGVLERAVIGPYSKTNWDGRRTKSVTAVVPNAVSTPIGLLCINLDVSLFETLQGVCRDFLSFEGRKDRPTALFRDDWREDVNAIVGQYVTDHATTFAQLDKRQRVDLIGLLDTRGLFEVRKAIPYIASLLNLSRATLYKSLAAARELANKDPL